MLEQPTPHRAQSSHSCLVGLPLWNLPQLPAPAPLTLYPLAAPSPCLHPTLLSQISHRHPQSWSLHQRFLLPSFLQAPPTYCHGSDHCLIRPPLQVHGGHECQFSLITRTWRPMCTYPRVGKGQQGLLRPFNPFSCLSCPERVQGWREGWR